MFDLDTLKVFISQGPTHEHPFRDGHIVTTGWTVVDGTGVTRVSEVTTDLHSGDDISAMPTKLLAAAFELANGMDELGGPVPPVLDPDSVRTFVVSIPDPKAAVGMRVGIEAIDTDGKRYGHIEELSVLPGGLLWQASPDAHLSGLIQRVVAGLVRAVYQHGD